MPTCVIAVKFRLRYLVACRLAVNRYKNVNKQEEIAREFSVNVSIAAS